ncbi:porphobilinogen synthase [bacterium]|nr:porphobilinogen synthase [bacterium]
MTTEKNRTHYSTPFHRFRRLRKSAALRDLVREHAVARADLVQPLFVVPGRGVEREISSLPGQYQRSVDALCTYAGRLVDSGILAVLLFGIPEEKDAIGSAAWSSDGIIQEATRALKKEFPDLLIISDLCFCEYTDHGHCGVLREGDVDNDPTLVNLARQAVSHAEAGVDIIAPSGMMDGMVRAIRSGLDERSFFDLPIMSYAVKFASQCYGPFREAAQCAPSEGDRRSYQMDPANGEEALREAAADVEEGADFLMVKPALFYLDIIHRVKERFHLPVAAYNVSGEYAMIKAAAAKGWLDEVQVVLESLLSMKRAGADILITYSALDIADHLP